jgi:hypothetical protein
MNNDVHWAGYYPLGFALDYGFGKFITKKNISGWCQPGKLHV